MTQYPIRAIVYRGMADFVRRRRWLRTRIREYRDDHMVEQSEVTPSSARKDNSEGKEGGSPWGESEVIKAERVEGDASDLQTENEIAHGDSLPLEGAEMGEGLNGKMHSCVEKQGFVGNQPEVEGEGQAAKLEPTQEESIPPHPVLEEGFGDSCGLKESELDGKF